MFTPRRSDSGYGNYGGRDAVGVLEREKSLNADFNVEETDEEAKERMHKNLDKLLNFDRYSQITEEIAPIEEVKAKPVEEVAPKAVSDEDLMPSSTTRQFGDSDAESVYNDMMREKEQSKDSFKLNLKGKIMLALYAVAVTVILALIIVNSGVLMALRQSNANSAAELNALSGEYNRVVEDIRSISGDDYISGVAENELGMIK